MPSAYSLPSCVSRLAQLKLRYFVVVLTLVVAWSTAASESLFAGKPVLRFLGPTHRDQPRSADEARAFSVEPCNKVSQVRIVPQQAVSGQGPRLASHLIANWPDDLDNMLAYEVPPESPDTPPQAIATDRQSETDPANPSRQSPEQSGCFVAAPMASLTVDASLSPGLLPDNVAAQCAATIAPMRDSRLQGGWAVTEQHWSATCQYHLPLYFEEANAERYGYTPSYCLQPLISAGRFFATIPALPYKMTVERPRECAYTLGHYRPGSCGPRRWHHLPCHAGAAVVEAGMIAGLILLIP